MTDTAARVAGLDDERLLDLHKSLDQRDPADPAVVEAHHLVAVEMLKRGHQHGHDGDLWAAAAVLVEKVSVDSPDEIEAPEGLSEAWEKALAKGGDVSILLTADGYVLKASPSVNTVHVDSVMDDETGEDEADEGPLDWDSDELLASLSDGDKVWLGTVAAILDAGGDPDEAVEKAGNPEPLRDYWRAGGKGKINWGAGGDFTACAAAVSKYMTSEQAKGYCAIRHREVTGMWPGDKRNRTKKSAEPVGILTLPDGTTYEPVSKHGDPSRPGYASMHPNGAQHAGGQGITGGRTSLPKKDLKAVKGALSRGEQVESYGDGYAKGKAAARGENIHGEPIPWRVSSTGTGRNKVEAAIATRDAALAAFKQTQPGGIDATRATLAATVAHQQGYIDGVMGFKPSMARSHGIGETLAGFMFGGLSGATKSADLVEQVTKHGDPSRPGYAQMHPTSRAGLARTHTPAGHPDVPDKVTITVAGKGFDLVRGVDVLHDHIEPDGKGGFRISTERQQMHADMVADMVAGKPAQEHPVFTMLGGGGGSGKSTLDRTGLLTDPDVHVKIDPDEIKVSLSERDPAFKALTKDARAGAAHEESSLVAHLAQQAAFAQRSHVLLDGTGNAGAASAIKKVETARAAGYEVNGVYASVPTQLAWARNVYRGTHDPNRGVVAPVHLAAAHRSVSDITPEIAPHFDRFTLFDTTRAMQEGPRQLASTTKGEPLKVDDQAGYDSFRAKATGLDAAGLRRIKIPKAYLESGPPPDESHLPASFFE